MAGSSTDPLEAAVKRLLEWYVQDEGRRQVLASSNASLCDQSYEEIRALSDQRSSALSGYLSSLSFKPTAVLFNYVHSSLWEERRTYDSELERVEELLWTLLASKVPEDKRHEMEGGVSPLRADWADRPYKVEMIHAFMQQRRVWLQLAKDPSGSLTPVGVDSLIRRPEAGDSASTDDAELDCYEQLVGRSSPHGLQLERDEIQRRLNDSALRQRFVRALQHSLQQRGSVVLPPQDRRRPSVIVRDECEWEAVASLLVDLGRSQDLHQWMRVFIVGEFSDGFDDVVTALVAILSRPKERR